MRPLTAPRLQSATREPAARADEEQQQQYVQEQGCELGVQATVAPRPPALVYLEPPVLSTAALHSSAPVMSPEREPRGGSCRTWAWEQPTLAGRGAATVADPGISVDLHIPPDVLQGLEGTWHGHEQQHQQQQGAADATSLGRVAQGTDEKQWQLVVVATAAASDDLEAPSSPVLLHSVAAVPPAARAFQHTAPTPSPLHAHLPPAADPPALAAAQELNTNCHATPCVSLRLQLSPSILRRLGVLPAADAPPSPFFSARGTRHTPIPTLSPCPRASSCPGGSHAAATAPPAPPCTPRAFTRQTITSTAGESCSSTNRGTLLHLHLLAVPQGAPLHLELDGDQSLSPWPRRHVSDPLSPPHAAWASQRRLSSPAACPVPFGFESPADGHPMDRGPRQQEQQQQQQDSSNSRVSTAARGQHGATASGTSGRGTGDAPWGRRVSWSSGVSGTVA